MEIDADLGHDQERQGPLAKEHGEGSCGFRGRRGAPPSACCPDPRPSAARTLLDKYHIDLNGAENGLKLTRRVHQTSGLQRKKAIRDVTARLRRAAEGAKKLECREVDES